jgi:hypothetical protein
MTDSSRTAFVAVLAAAVTMSLIASADLTFADGPSTQLGAGPALKLKASVIGPGTPVAPMTIELFRWSSDAERAPLLTALAAPPPAPSSAPAAPAAGRAGRAARGGRGAGAAAPPQSPLERLTTAIKAAPTVGFVWTDSPTGYSIKYAWRSAAPGTQERVVLVTDRRLGANTTSWPAATGAAVNAEFTVVEMRLDGKGLGEAKSSLTSKVVVDAAANTLALEAYADAPVLLKVTR